MYLTDAGTSWSVLLCFFCLGACFWLVPNGFVVVWLVSKLEVPDAEWEYHLNFSWIKCPQMLHKQCHPPATSVQGSKLHETDDYTNTHQRPCRICKTMSNKFIVTYMKVNNLIWILRSFQCFVVWWHEFCLFWLLYLMSGMNSHAQKGRWK